MQQRASIHFDDGRILVSAGGVDDARLMLPEVRVLRAARGEPGLYEAPVAPRTLKALRSMGVDIPADIQAACDEHVRQIRQIDRLRGRLYEGALPSLDEHMAPGTKLRRVQHVGALIALSADRTALYMDMGTGKTLASLVACAHRFKNHGLRRVLVVAPATVAGGWKGDIQRLAMREQVEFVHAAGSQAKRRRQYVRGRLVGGGDDYLAVMAVSYGSLANDAESIIEKFDPQAFIIDESHYVKNMTSARTVACKRVADHAQWVTQLTGTPYSEQPTDIFAQYSILDWRIFGASRDVFVERFCSSKPNYAAGENARPGEDGQPVLPQKVKEGDPAQTRLLNRAIYTIGFRARKEDVLDLPDKRPPIMHEVELTAKSLKVIESLRKDGLADLDDAIGIRDQLASIIAREESRIIDMLPEGENATDAKVMGGAVSAEVLAHALDLMDASEKQRAAAKPTVGGLRALLGNQRMVVASTKMVIGLRVQQASGGFAKVEEIDAETGEATERTVSVGTEKLDALRDMAISLHAENESVVVFARFRAEIDAIEERLRRVYGKAHVSRIDGTVPVPHRSGIVDAFQVEKGPPRAIVLQVSSGAAGITLTRARHAVYFSMGYSATDYWQSQDRIHRIGQGRPCFYHLLVASGSDDRVTIDALAHKRSVADAVVESWRATL